MKNILKLTGVAALLFLGVGCSEEFLDQKPTQFLTTDQVGEAAEKNTAVTRGTLTGIYSLMIETGTGGTNLSHDDFGHKGYDIFGDMLSGDMALSVSTYGWYRSDITEFNAPLDFTRTTNYQVWRYYYRIIRSANTVIDALGGNEAVPENEENKAILGQAKAIRAHSYFYLAQYFQKEYNPTEEILPLYDDLLDQNGPKVTAQVIYDFIEQDLNSAISLLEGYQRLGKNEINTDVAKGILAYVNGAQHDWQEVYDLTSEVIASGGYPIMSAEEVLGGFNDLNTPGWMWGIDITADASLGLVSWWGQMDLYTYSYAWAGDAKAIDSGLYEQIPEGDVRKMQFEEPTGVYEDLMPLYKFYHPAREIGGQATITTDYIFMRISEMYLLNAEAAAHLGNDAAAIASLKAVLDERLESTSYLDMLTGQALLDEIYLQTRIEFWGEGKSYLAMKRNEATIVRGDNHLSFVGVPIPYNDERLTFEIPESEIQNNPFISTQNP